MRLKFKVWVIEQWLEANLRGYAHHAFGYNADERKRISQSEHAFQERIAFGFNADETRRIDRSCEYNTLTTQSILSPSGVGLEPCEMRQLHPREPRSDLAKVGMRLLPLQCFER